MALNLTGIDENAYLWAVSSVFVARCAFISLPSLVLCVLCVVALLVTKEINQQMKVILLNIFAADVCYWLATIVLYLEFPIRARQEPDVVPICVLFYSMAITSNMAKFTAVALYATTVYFFIKYGVRKLKWIAIIVYIVVSWTVILSFAMVPYFRSFDLINNGGFCETMPGSVLLTIFIAVLAGTAVFSLCAVLIFSMLTYCYTKHAISSDDTDNNSNIKQAIVRYLLYLAITSVLSLLVNIISSTYPLIRVSYADSGVVLILVLNSFFGIVLNLLSAATPVVAFIVLKPVRVATKDIFKKVCSFCKKNAVAPAGN